MKWFVIGIFLLLKTLCCYSQIIDNSSCTSFSDQPFFSVDFIMKNHIKTITGKISTKAKMDIIHDHGLITQYIFDSLGRQTGYTGTFTTGYHNIDTSVVNYFYDDNNRIITLRRNDSHGFYSYNYSFDENAHLVEQTYVREENDGPDSWHFIPGHKYVIMSETYSYSNPDSNALVKQYHNCYGKVYQTETFSFDKDGYLLQIEKILKMGHRKSGVSYEYNERGLVSKKTEYSVFEKKNEISHIYKYDTLGNLLVEDIYHNGVYVTNRELLYDEKTMLFKAMIVQDIKTDFITMSKYTFEYYK